MDEQRVPGLTALKGSVPTITSVYAEIFGFSYLFNVVDYGGEQVLPVDVIDVCYIHLCERTDFHKVIHTVIKFHLSSTVFDIIAKKNKLCTSKIVACSRVKCKLCSEQRSK